MFFRGGRYGRTMTRLGQSHLYAFSSVMWSLKVTQNAARPAIVEGSVCTSLSPSARPMLVTCFLISPSVVSG